MEIALLVLILVAMFPAGRALLASLFALAVVLGFLGLLLGIGIMFMFGVAQL